MQHRAFRNYKNLPKTLLILLNVCQISTIKKDFLTQYLLRVYSTNVHLMERVYNLSLLPMSTSEHIFFLVGDSQTVLVLKNINTAQKMKFSIKDFFSECDQICSFLRIWSHLLKKPLIENFFFLFSERSFALLLLSFLDIWLFDYNPQFLSKKLQPVLLTFN